MAKTIRLDKQAARVVAIQITRPDNERNLRDAGRAMAVDKQIQEALGEYDTRLEALIKEAKVANRTKTGEDLRLELSRINTAIEDMDEVAATEVVELVLENSEFDFTWAYLKSMRGVPADRHQGAIFQRISDAFENAEKVNR